jgi:hypothetical protein
VVVIGERGLGKSHLMAALYHAVTDPASTGAWLKEWAPNWLTRASATSRCATGCTSSAKACTVNATSFYGTCCSRIIRTAAFIKGKWEGQGASKTEIPSDKLIIELLEHKPTMLLLDEFQTWYDGFTNTKQYPWKNWAFNFIQILSEIAKERPDLLVLGNLGAKWRQRRLPAGPSRQPGRH